MTSAQVLLGVMPTVLAVIGASTEEMSMLANVSRRPFLALLLSMASPSVYFSRAFKYSDPTAIMQVHPNRLPQWRPRTKLSRRLIATTEYIVAVGMIGYVAHINWQLGVRTTCAFWSDNVFAPMVWALLGIVVHFFGMVVLRLRLRGWRGRPEDVGQREEEVHMMNLNRGNRNGLLGIVRWCRGISGRAMSIAKTEFEPSAYANYDSRIVTFQESKTFLVCAWLLSVFTVSHVIYGTLVFASTVFISPTEALVVLVRYAISVSVCRIVLMYELAGLRSSCVKVGPLEQRELVSNGNNSGIITPCITLTEFPSSTTELKSASVVGTRGIVTSPR
ncbi:hypothetical protein QBC35DRAFT_495842 [Podospora australis]|uniref:Uncharacterized protein n=1 Tax=Podospora australis TaxID=1536484 RepID=A0AAN7AJ53_9PEZI|nr:hypothetical protein QBC35DRAFT_495842 [Podospora australis]